MNVRDLIRKLSDMPQDAHVLLKVGNEWQEAFDVTGTGQHRNAVTITTYNPNLPGVIVADPEEL